MKCMLNALAIAVSLAAPAAAIAAESPMTAQQAVAHIESLFPGQVVAVRYDRSPVEGGHYLIDLRFAYGAVAKLEMDAATRALVSIPPVHDARPAMTLRQAVAHATSLLPGRVVSAEFDATQAKDPHYHVDLVHESGHPLTLRVDPNGDVFWRETAVE